MLWLIWESGRKIYCVRRLTDKSFSFMRLGRIISIPTQWFWNLTYEFKMVGSHLLKTKSSARLYCCFCCFHFSLQFVVFFFLLFPSYYCCKTAFCYIMADQIRDLGLTASSRQTKKGTDSLVRKNYSILMFSN